MLMRRTSGSYASTSLPRRGDSCYGSIQHSKVLLAHSDSEDYVFIRGATSRPTSSQKQGG